MKILSSSSPSTPQGTLDICKSHTLTILELGRQRQKNQEFHVTFMVNSKSAYLQETLSQNTEGYSYMAQLVSIVLA